MPDPTSGLPDMPGTSPGSGLRAWFSRKEGRWGVLWTLALIAGGVALFNVTAPAILTALGFATAIVGKTIMLVVYAIILAILGVIVLDRSNWTKAWFVYRAINTAITDFFIGLNPIRTMKTYLERLMKHLATLREEKQNVGGEAESIDSQMRENDQLVEEKMQLIQSAAEVKREIEALTPRQRAARQDELDEASIVLQDRGVEVEELQASNSRLAVISQRLHKLDDFLGIALRASERAVTRLEFQIKTRASEMRAAKSGVRALRSAWACLRGHMDEKQLYDMATEHWRAQTGRMVAEIKDLIEASRSYTAAQRMNDRTAERRSLEMLAKWAKRGDSELITAEEKRGFLSVVRDEPATVVTPEVQTHGKGGEKRGGYRDLLGQ